MSDVKAVNEKREEIRTYNPLQHLGTTAEERSLLEAGEGTATVQQARAVKTTEQTLQERANEQGTRVHNMWDDQVAKDLQQEAGQLPHDPDDPAGIVPEPAAIVGPGSVEGQTTVTRGTGGRQVVAAGAATGPTGASGATGPTGASSTGATGSNSGSVTQSSTTEGLENKTVDELRDQARSLGVDGTSSMKKAELVAAIQKAERS